MKDNNKQNYSVMNYTTTLVMCLLLLTSCDNFLTEDPTQEMTSDRQFEGSNELESLTNGAYRSLPEWDADAGIWNHVNLHLEYFTGKATSEDSHVRLSMYQNDQVTGSLLETFNTQWEYWYQGVRDANFSINAINNITEVSEEDRSRALGEVRTLRAFYYFNLVRYFGDVVLETTSIESPEEAQKPRTSIKQIYDEVIIPDLEFAVNESQLEDTRSIAGEVTKHVARVILADVYLTAAGYPYQEIATNPEQNWSEEGLWSQQDYPVNSQSAQTFLSRAQEQLNVLYGSYNLGAYGDIRDPAMDNSGGAIFQIQFADGINENQLINNTLPNASRTSQFGSETGSYIPTMGYYNSFDPADERKQDGVYFYSSDTIAPQYNPDEPLINFSRPYLFKFYDTNAVKETGRSSLNWSLYRYADVLLMLTEVNWSLRELGVSVSNNDIVKGINEVRDQANLPTYTANEVNLKNIMGERAYELIFENKMIWDQRRTRKVLVVGNGEFSEMENFIGHSPSTFNYSFGPKHLLSPIPVREINTNSQMRQNFGYLPRQ